MWPSRQSKPGIPCLGPVPLCHTPPNYEIRGSHHRLGTDTLMPSTPWPVTFEALEWVQHQILKLPGESQSAAVFWMEKLFPGLAPRALLPCVSVHRLWSTRDLKDLAWNFDQSNYLYAFSVEVVWGVAVREIELSETNIRVIREYFFFVGHPRWIAGKIKFKIKLNMYTTLLFC